MKLEVRLFCREHHNGCFTVEVIGEPDLQVYCTKLERAREDLQLLLSDRFERLHPGQLSQHATPPDLRLEQIEVPDVIRVGGDVPERRAALFSVVVTEDRKRQRLWLPRWDLHHWISADTELQPFARELINDHVVGRASQQQLLAHRTQGREWIESMEVEFEPARLEDFAGEFRGKKLLPYPEDVAKPDPNQHTAPLPPPPVKAGQPRRPPTPTLRKVGLNLSSMARHQELERAHGRKKELEELLHLLLAPGGKAVALVGPSGVGKTTILNELVSLFARGAPSRERDRTFWYADASRLIAGEGLLGDWQQQCLDVIQECADAQAIWYVGQLLALLDAGKSVNSDQNVSLLLKPHLVGGRLTIIGECTPEAWARLELRDAGFAGQFSVYRMDEVPADELPRILGAVAEDLELERDVCFEEEGLRAVQELGRRYGGQGSLLGSCLSFMRRISCETGGQGTQTPGRAEVVRCFCLETGLPEMLVRDDLPLDPESIRAHFRHRLFGQDEAVRRMTDLVAMIKAGLSDQHRPLGSFLFVGPTGVGKTEMAKALAGYLFSDQGRLIRFDMSEFVNASDVARFLGDATQEGRLVTAVRRCPFSVVLLDEIEKAHAAVFDVLLQVLGEARLTDEAGRTADFRNTVVLMTSNLGVGTYQRQAGFGHDPAAGFTQHFVDEARRFFRPEFFNRIDFIVPFLPLEQDAIREIAGREVARFLGREGIRARSLDFELGSAVTPWLADQGVDPRYGARPLKRVLEQRLAAPLARHLSTIKSGHRCRVEVSVGDDTLDFANSDLRGGGAEAGKETRDAEELLRRLSLLRFRIQRWRDSSCYRELAQQVRLAERLYRDTVFRDATEHDHARRARLGRELLEVMDRLWSQVTSLEDLAHETRYDRNPEPLPTLLEELAAAETQLSELELRLFSSEFSTPGAAVLYLRGGRGSGPLLKDLAGIYWELAREHRWSVGHYTVGQRGLTWVSRQGFPVPQKKQRTRLSGELERLRTVWRLVRWSEPQRGGRYRSPPFFGDLEELLQYALVLEGEHVCSLLCGEGGWHQRVQDDATTWVDVVFAGGRVGRVEGASFPAVTRKEHPESAIKPVIALEHPQDLAALRRREHRRVINLDRREVQDSVLDLRLPVEPRLHRVYGRMMRANIYHEVFGAEGLKWYRRSR